MTNQPLADAKGVVELHDGVVYLRWTCGAVIGESDARAVMAKVSGLCSGRPRPMLVDMGRMEWIDHRARGVFAADWPLTRVAIVGASPMDRVIVNFYQARQSPACPTRFFMSFTDALAWLGEADASPEAGDASEADTMLSLLLEHVEAVLSETRVDSSGLPLFVVEEKLTARLRAALPGVRFTAHDVRSWSAEISS